MGLLRQRDKVTPAAKATAAGVTLACLVSLTGALVARADTVEEQKKKADQRISALGQQLEGTNASLAKAYVNLERTKAVVPVAQAKLAAAQSAAAAALAAQQAAEVTERAAIDAEAKARAHNDATAQRLAVAQANQQRAVERLAKSSTDLVSSQDALDAYAAEVFQGGGGSESQLSLVFGSTSPQDFADKIVMAETASAVAADTIDRLATMTADNTSTRAYLTSVRAEIAELKRQAEEALRGAEAAAAAATQAKDQAVIARNNAVIATNNATEAKAALDSLQSQQTVYAADLATQRSSETQQLAAARAESARLKAVLVERARQARIAEAKRLARLKAEREARIRAERAAAERARQARIKAERDKAAAERTKGRTYTPRPVAPSGPTPSEQLPPVGPEPTPSNYLTYPASGPTTSPYGMRWHPVLGKWMLHDGLDWGISCGTPVYAAAPGEVISAGWGPSGWGNQVLIDHGIKRGVNLVTSYNHLSRIVKFGGTVDRGQLIGYSGTTGYSTGCHLHFGTYEDGNTVNPRNWL